MVCALSSAWKYGKQAIKSVNVVVFMIRSIKQFKFIETALKINPRTIPNKFPAPLPYSQVQHESCALPNLSFWGNRGSFQKTPFPIQVGLWRQLKTVECHPKKTRSRSTFASKRIFSIISFVSIVD